MSTIGSNIAPLQPSTIDISATTTTPNYEIKLEENDNILLNHLLFPNPNDEHNTTTEVANHFNDLLHRIKNRNNGKITPNLHAWDDAISKLQKCGWSKLTTTNNASTTTTTTATANENERVISQETLTTISSLLGVSLEQAECMSNFTLSTITQPSILNEKKNNNVTSQVITSSASFLQRVSEFYFQQCLADVRIIVESLIIATTEDDEEDGQHHPYKDACLIFLKELDGLYFVVTSSEKDSRGLFRLLTDIAFCDGSTIEMKNDKCAEEFMESWKETYTSFLGYCQKEAMDGLLLLCYQYMNVTRTDLALFLTFWEMRLEDDFQLWQEASWIGAELFSLWKCSNKETHSLLEGEHVVEEWNVLLELVSHLFSKHQQENTFTSPDSLLVIFCMGLFLLTYHQSFPENIENIKSMGLECINTSNQYGVFDVLNTSLQSTVDKKQLILYHTIAREMFLVMIQTLQNNCSKEEYITLFAKVGSVVYNNLEPLCAPFWMEWEDYASSYKSGEEKSLERGVCKLLHLCQHKALVERQNITSKEKVVESLSYIQLLCSLVHDETTVQYVYGNLLPCAFLKEIINGCIACSSIKDVQEIIRSLAELLHNGGAIGRSIFRQILQLDGLQQIHRTLFSSMTQIDEGISTALQFFNYMIAESKLVGEECDFAYAIALYTKRDLRMDQVSSSTSIHSFLDLSSSLVSHIPSFLSSDKSSHYLQLVLDYVRICSVYFTSSHLEWNTTSVSLKVIGLIHEFLECVTSLAQLHQDEEVLSIRDELILRILPSKDVASKLAILATVPISKVLQDHWNSIVDFNISASKANEKNKNCSWFQKIEDCPSSKMNTSDYITKVLKELHLLPSPNMADEDYDVSCKAIKLIHCWITCTTSAYTEDLVVSPVDLLMSTISTPLLPEVPSNVKEYQSNDESSFFSFCVTYLDLLLRYVMIDEVARESGSSTFIVETVLDIFSQCIQHSKTSLILPIIQDKNLYANMVEPILTSHHNCASLQVKVLSLLESAAHKSLDMVYFFVDKDKIDVVFDFWKKSMKEYQTRNDWDSLMICAASSSLASTLVNQSNRIDENVFYSLEDQSKIQDTWSTIKNMLSHLLNQIQSTSTTGIDKEFIPILHTFSKLIQFLSGDIWDQLKKNKANSENFRELVDDVMSLSWDSLLQKDVFDLSFQSGFQQVLEKNVWMDSFCSTYIQRQFRTNEEQYNIMVSFAPSPLVSFLHPLEGGVDLSSCISSFLDAMYLLSTQSSLMSSFGQFIQLSLAVTHREKGNALSLQTPQRRKFDQTSDSPHVNRVLLTYTNWIRPLFQSILLVLIDYTSTNPLIWNRLQVVDDARGILQSSMFLKCYGTFNEVVSVFVKSLLSLSHYASQDSDSLEDMFELLYQVSSRLFSLLDPPSSLVLLSVAVEERQSLYDRALEIGCNVKKNILSCAMILVKQYVISSASVQRTPTSVPISDTPQRSHFRDKKSMVEPRVGFLHLICDTLRLLCYKEHKSGVSTGNSLYQYSFDTSSSYEWNLYLSCLYLLDSLISLKTINSKTSKFFCRSLCEVIHNEDLLSLLLQHFQVACRVAAETYISDAMNKNDKMKETKHDHSIFVAQRIMEIIYHIMGVVLSSNYIPCYSKLVSLILKDEAFFYSIVENPLFRLACAQWSSSSDVNKAVLVRGYIALGGSEINKMNFVGSGTSTRPQAKVDPVHLLWRTTLSTLSSLLRLSSLSSNVSDDHDNWKTCFHYVTDFLSSYEVAITSLIKNITVEREKVTRNISSFSPPSNQLFTVNYLQELCDTLSFLSELFSEAHYRNLLVSTHPSFYNNFLSNLLEITRCLSAFIGSAAIARRLFSMLNHKKRRTSFDSPGMISRYYSTSLRDTNSSASMSPFPSSSSSFIHGAGGGTIPNARHEAIGYSHYASSCCVVMTAEDAADYSSVTDEDVNSVSEQSSNTLDKFQIHVNNKFTLRTELYASRCLFHALGILSNTHSAWVGFVPFQSHEAKNFFTSSSMHETVEVGNIIALRPLSDSSKLVSIKEKEELRYATIVATHTRNGATSWDVEYFPSFVASSNGNEISSERFVSTSRFAGMIDNTKWKSLLAYDDPVMPKSVSELASLDNISIAHIAFIFQWCQEQMSSDNGIVDCSPNETSHIKHLAERASIFLSMDMLCSSGQEQQIFSHGNLDNRVRNMAQLLDLFLDDDDSNSTATVSTPATPIGHSFGGNSGGRSPGSAQRHQDSINLRNLIDCHVWETSVSLLRKQINMYHRGIGLGYGETRSVTPLPNGDSASLFG